jgi:hypothetical protein
MREHEIYCYQELDHHIEGTRLSERLILLETKSRVSSKIAVEEWRTLLRDELEYADSGLRRAVANIAEGAMAQARNVVLYHGVIKPFKACMAAEGFTVEAVYLQHYWRSPLEVLRVIAGVKGVDSLSNKMIARCVQCHLRYLDHVLSSNDVDAAHKQWTHEIRRKPVKEIRFPKTQKAAERCVGVRAFWVKLAIKKRRDV